MAIARVQTISVTTAAGGTAASLLITLGAATTAGNILIVATQSQSGTAMKVTSAHGIFSDVTPQGINTSGTASIVHIFMGIMSGADTAITIGVIPNTRIAAVATEYSGSRIAYSDIPTNVQSTTATPNTAAITNADANSLYVAAIGQKAFNSSTTNTAWASNPTSPFNIAAQNTTSVNASNVDYSICYLDAIVTTSSSRNVSVASALGSLASSGVLATLHEIAAGGGIRAAGTGGLAV